MTASRQGTRGGDRSEWLALGLIALLALGGGACRAERPRPSADPEGAGKAARASRDSGASFKFAVLGCAHLGVCGADELRRAVQVMKQHRPDFVQFLGATVDVAGEPDDEHGAGSRRLSEAQVTARWREFDEVVRELGVPVYDVAGERGVPSNNSLVTGREFARRFGARDGTYVHKGNLFIRLDSGAPRAGGQGAPPHAARVALLRRALARSSEYRNVFVFSHESPWAELLPAPTWWTQVHPLLNGKVEHVFGAANHYLDQIQVEGVRYTTSGFAGCWPLESDLDEERSFAHFLLVEVKGRDVAVRPIPLTPMSAEERTRRVLPVDGGGLVPSYVFKQPNQARTHAFRRTLGSSLRLAYMKPDEVVREMDLRPGMKVLDLGAGSGMFTFRMARAVRGEGRVFATELRDESVHYLQTRARLLGLGNVRAVKVEARRVDPLYRQHTFDRILLATVVTVMKNREGLLAGLAPSLAKGTGRLFVIHERAAGSFMPEAIDPDDARAALRQLAAGSPILRRLGRQTRSLLAPGADDPARDLAFARALAADLNRMLEDRRLPGEIIGEQRSPRGHFLKDDVKLGLWLLMTLGDKRVLGDATTPIDRLDRLSLRRLNRLLLARVLPVRFTHGATYSDRLVIPPKWAVVDLMKRAGLKLERDLPDLLPYNDVLVFSR